MQKKKLALVVLLLGLRTVSGQANDDLATLNAEYRNHALIHGGDRESGEKLFNSSKCLCANCHQLTGKEKSGPNLDGIAQKYSRSELITHVLEPSVSVMPGFGQTTVSLSDGRTITGRIERATKLEVRIIDATGKQTNLKRNAIEGLQLLATSMMPSNLASTITKEEFCDVIAYLETLHYDVTTGRGAGNVEIPIPHLKKAIEFERIHENHRLESPVWCGPLPGYPGHLLVLEHQEGRIWRLNQANGNSEKEPFLDLADDIYASPNQGLMCLAFHPDFQKNGRYFLEHEVEENGKVKTLIVERLATQDRLRDSGSKSIRLLEVEQPAFNHNGGCIAFGLDGMLYAAFGDGGPQKDPNGYSQNPGDLKGSMVRIDIDHRDGELPYAVPTDNPFLAAGRENQNLRPETWAIGFREPWRFSFDRISGDLWLGDVGQDKFEEVAIVKRGENHGWNVREGFESYSNEFHRTGEEYTDPILAYEHGLGFSITGGYVYRANEASSFYGVYIFGDFNTRRVWGLQRKQGKLIVRQIGTAPGGIASFGEDHDGEILLITYDGAIYRLGLKSGQFDS